MAANPFKIPSLIEIVIEDENRVINACYLIQDVRTGRPDPKSDVLITVEPGEKIRLKGKAAQLWCRRLAKFIIADEEDIAAVTAPGAV